MPGNYSHTNRADGTTLTAAIYNSDHVNHINNATPQGVDDYSSSVTEMRTTADPGEVGTESLPTSLAGELERLRFKIAELAKFLNDGTAVAQWYTTPSGVPLAQPKRNWIINGDFDIWQRGTSQTTPGYGSDDRWFNDHAGSTKTHSRGTFTIGQTEVPGNPTYFSQTNVTAGAGVGDFVRKVQRIEDVTALAGQTVTLSFYAKASANLDISIEFHQFFGSGGTPSPNVERIGVTKLALTTAWQKFSVTVNIPGISGKTLGTNQDHYTAVRFWFDAGSNFNTNTNILGHQSGTFYLARVKVEIGSVATEMEREPIEETLRKCQRYYEKSYNLDDSLGTSVAYGGPGSHLTPLPIASYTSLVNVFFKVTKRAANPSIAIYSKDGTPGMVTDISSGVPVNVPSSIFDVRQNGFRVSATTSAAATQVNYSFHYAADAEL